ncbi:MAG: hypothetical protein ACE5EO_12885 [Candidatus Krumholzibacteriia bacterium]
MSGERLRSGFTRVVLAIFSMTLLGGCAHADPTALETFVVDLLRSAAAALLL